MNIRIIEKAALSVAFIISILFNNNILLLGIIAIILLDIKWKLK